MCEKCEKLQAAVIRLKRERSAAIRAWRRIDAEYDEMMSLSHLAIDTRENLIDAQAVEIRKLAAALGVEAQAPMPLYRPL